MFALYAVFLSRKEQLSCSKCSVSLKDSSSGHLRKSTFKLVLNLPLKDTSQGYWVSVSIPTFEDTQSGSLNPIFRSVKDTLSGLLRTVLECVRQSRLISLKAN